MFPNLPDDIILIIAKHLTHMPCKDPRKNTVNLLNFSAVCSRTHNLLHEDHRIWGARGKMGKRLDALVGCERCKAPRIRKIRMPFQIRVCEPCFRAVTIRCYELEKLNVPRDYYADFPYSEHETYSKHHGFDSYRSYLIRDVEYGFAHYALPSLQVYRENYKQLEETRAVLYEEACVAMREHDEIKRVKKIALEERRATLKVKRIALEEKRVIKRTTWEGPILEWITTNNFDEKLMHKAITCHFNTGKCKYSAERFPAFVTAVLPKYNEYLAEVERERGRLARRVLRERARVARRVLKDVAVLEYQFTCDLCHGNKRKFKQAGLSQHQAAKHGIK